MKLEISLQFFLVCLLILGVSVFLGALYSGKTESFQDMKLITEDFDIQVQACPSGTSSYNNKGDILCCDGMIVNGICNGRTLCSISDDKPTMPSCVNLIRTEFKTKANRFCPPTLPNYFEDLVNKRTGCTAGKRTPDGKAPLTTSQAKCTIYANFEDNQTKLDSCDNIKQRDLFKCPGAGNRGTLTSTTPGKPVTVQCTFSTMSDALPRTCYSDKSLSDYLLAVNGADWNKNMSRDTKLSFCSTAEKFYIRRALSEQELTLVEGPFTK